MSDTDTNVIPSEQQMSEIQQTMRQDPAAQPAQVHADAITGQGQFSNPGNIVLPSLKLEASPPASPTNAAPAPPPGSFAARFRDAFVGLSKLGGMGSFSETAALAGLHAAATPSTATPQDQGGAGNVTWEQAQQNDTTAPINPNQIPQEDRAHQVQRGILGTVGSLFDPNVSTTEISKRMQEENTNRLANSMSNLQMVKEQQLLHKAGAEEAEKAAVVGKQQLDFMLTAPESKLIAEGKTSDEIRAGLRTAQNPSGAFDPHSMQIFQTGRVQVGTDKTGTPLFRSTYSVVVPGGPITLGEENEAQRTYINKMTGRNLQQGQTLPAAQFGALMQEANNASSHWALIQKVNQEEGERKHKEEMEKNDQDFMKIPIVGNTINEYCLNGSDKFSFQKAFVALNNAAATDPKVREALPQNWVEQFKYTYSAHDPDKFDENLKEYMKQRQEAEDTLKQLEKPEFMATHYDAVAGLVQAPMANVKAKRDGAQKVILDSQNVLNNPNADANAKQKAQQDLQTATAAFHEADAAFNHLQGLYNTAQKISADVRAGKADTAGAESRARVKAGESAIGGDNNLTGDAYIRTLPQDQQNALKAVSEGRETRSPRQLQDKSGNLTPFAAALHRAYPDFDIEKASKYGKVRGEYESTKPGTPGGALNAGATAVKHLARLKEINDANPVDVRIHGTAANKEYNNLLDTVADELVTFYGEPKTNEARESKKSTLGGLTNRNAAILEQVRAMGEKFGSYEKSWNNASPRPSYQPPMPQIDEESKIALQRLDPDFVKAHPQFAPGQQQGTATPTTPASANDPFAQFGGQQRR